MTYEKVLNALRTSEYLMCDIDEMVDGKDIVTTINKRLKLIPLHIEDKFKGLTMFIPVSHTGDVDKLVNTTAQVVHTITAMTTTAILIDAVTECGKDRAAGIMTILGMMADGGVAKYKSRVLHVEGNFNITRTSQQGMVIISIFERQSLDI